LALPVLYPDAFDAFEILKRSRGDQRDYPKEISDQHPEHHQEGDRGEQARSVRFFSK
jgi:hypothetical protein